MAHALAPAVCKESKLTALKLVLALTASDDEKGDGSNVPSGVALEVQHPIGSNRVGVFVGLSLGRTPKPVAGR